MFTTTIIKDAHLALAAMPFKVEANVSLFFLPLQTTRKHLPSFRSFSVYNSLYKQLKSVSDTILASCGYFMPCRAMISFYSMAFGDCGKIELRGLNCMPIQFFKLLLLCTTALSTQIMEPTLSWHERKTHYYITSKVNLHCLVIKSNNTYVIQNHYFRAKLGN